MDAKACRSPATTVETLSQLQVCCSLNFARRVTVSIEALRLGQFDSRVTFLDLHGQPDSLSTDTD
eukprot:2391518-Rhodomonas_salina.5